MASNVNIVNSEKIERLEQDVKKIQEDVEIIKKDNYENSLKNTIEHGKVMKIIGNLRWQIWLILAVSVSSGLHEGNLIWQVLSKLG